MNKKGWQWGDAKTFTVNISDPVSSYNMYINIRHTDEFLYNNLWLNIKTIFPDSTETASRVNVILSEPDGNWTGNCVDGICNNSVLVLKNFLLPQTGKYTFQLEQDMRINPLLHILHAGIRMEKFQEGATAY